MLMDGTTLIHIFAECQMIFKILVKAKCSFTPMIPACGTAGFL